MRADTPEIPSWVPSAAVIEELDRARRERVTDRPTLELPLVEMPRDRPPTDTPQPSRVVVIQL